MYSYFYFKINIKKKKIVAMGLVSILKKVMLREGGTGDVNLLPHLICPPSSYLTRSLIFRININIYYT